MIGSLFDKQRKDEIQKGLKGGKLDLSRKRPLEDRNTGEASPPPFPSVITTLEEKPGLRNAGSGAGSAAERNSGDPDEALTSEGIPARYFSDTDEEDGLIPLNRMFGYKPKLKASHQDELAAAVRERNLAKVQEAINRGARVNDIVPEKIVTVKSGLPPPRGGIKDVVYFMTPLRLAHKLGFDDIAELLRKNGANA